MKFNIDEKASSLQVIHDGGEVESLDLYGQKAFELLSHLWLQLGWNQKYTYSFAWMGRPVIQLPEDMIRVQEVLYSIKPTLLIETGIAHGGSLIFYASLFKAMERGRVVGVDIEIRPHNRKAIEEHELFPMIKLIEGDAVAEPILAEVRAEIKPDDRVMVILDSCHTKDHVLKELHAYAPMVSVGSYIVATDGFMKDLTTVPRGEKEWGSDNPVTAVHEFLAKNRNFVLEQPKWPFNESALNKNLTHWPESYLKRVS